MVTTMGLASWQNRLENHFSELSSRRRSMLPERRVFGLEHGLDLPEIQALMTALRAQIADGPPSSEHALAWIVYAAEIGYRYSGDEYWQTFEGETPGWIHNGDRNWIRQCFLWFQKEFFGVEPCGAWAKQFSIICWPITHAILPTDLQRQLARILYELRHTYSAELFESPSILGEHIAARSWNTTSRFQNLTQETQLLGQIAAALLLQGNFGTDTLIHPATLKRIGEDLDRERRAREWLRRARCFARENVQVRGIGIFGRSTTPSEIGQLEEARAEVVKLGIEPRLVLRPMDSTQVSWEVLLEIPNLSHLIIRFPHTREILMGSRCVVAGSAGSPLARSRCLHDRQQVLLSRWPRVDEVLLQFEEKDQQLEYLLRTECLLRPGPIWLFKIASDGLAYECRNLMVRPGAQYIIISIAGPIKLLKHTHEIPLSCEGVFGAIVNLPTKLNEEWEEWIKNLGIGQIKTVEVWPAGLSAASWDGEGHGEWLAYERPCFGIQSDHKLSNLKIIIDADVNTTLELSQVEPGEPIFVELPKLPLGLHSAHITALNSHTGQSELLGELNIVMRIREARSWFPGVSSHGPLLVQVEPSMPKLEQLWEGRVDVMIQGPTNRSVKCKVSFFEKDAGIPTVSKQLPPMQLPVTTDFWRTHFEKHFRKTKEAEKYYDTAKNCELEFAADELGVIKLRCERDFTPLRWAVRRQGQNYFVRLLDDSGTNIQPEVKHILFETPCVENKIEFASEFIVPESGGMYIARMSEITAAVIVAPVIRGLSDLGCNPSVDRGIRSAESIIHVLDISNLWRQARLTGDFISARRQREVLLVLVQHIIQLLCGDNWARTELAVCNKNSDISVLKSAISKRHGEIDIGENLAHDCMNLAKASLKERVRHIADIATRFHLIQTVSPVNELDSEWFSEFALRLSSDPGGVKTWAAEKLYMGLSCLLDMPALTRAARFLVLEIDHYLNSRYGPDELYASWGWK